MVGLLIAGIGVVIIGVLTIIYGIPIKEFSFGNTMILAGATVTSTGLLLLGLWVVARELRALAQRLASAGAGIAIPIKDPVVASAGQFNAGEDGAVVTSEQTAHSAGEIPASADSSSLSPAGANEPGGPAVTPDSPPEPPAKRRNLLFSSSSKKERERAAARAAEQASAEQASRKTADTAPQDPEISPRSSFDAAWPMNEGPRAESSFRRSARPSPELGGAATPDRPEPDAASREPAPPADATTVVTILKSGVVDGMAYSLYSDGSIEAQMAEGMVRFGSIDELRAHLDHRP